jgi:predicted kinase
MAIGSDHTRLIVLHGNSGSGKSTVATALREAYGRGVAWVSQDLIAGLSSGSQTGQVP